MNYIIITNNPLVQKNYAEREIICVERYIDVLVTTRNYIHQGSKLITHPQAGSIKPYETPYRTILISKIQGELDMDSLHHIELALERFAALSSLIMQKKYNEQCDHDFQLIDESLVRNAIVLSSGNSAC